MVVSVVMVVTMRRMMLASQQPGREEVHREADDGDCDGLGEVDGDRGAEAQEAFPADQQCDQCQDNRTREAGEVPQLSRAEGEARIPRMPAGVEIGQGRDQHGGRMGGHVPPVRDQGHGAVDMAGYDLDHHHGRGQGDDEPGAPLVTLVPVAEKDMAVAAG